jgi:hypothetical protein
MLVFDDILAFAKTAKTIQKFVEGQLVTILSTLGETEYQAASAALANIHLARRPRDQVLLAVGHLQSAHTAYQGIYHHSKNWKDLFTLATRTVALHKDVFTLSLMAICYKYLQEPLLMENCLQTILEAVHSWKRIEEGYTLGELTDPDIRRQAISDVASAVGSWFNAGSWPIMVDAAKNGFPEIKEEQILQLCAFLKYKPTPSSSATG